MDGPDYRNLGHWYSPDIVCVGFSGLYLFRWKEVKKPMKKLKQAFSVAGYNFRQWHRNPRVVITFVLAFILCFLLSNKVVLFARRYGTTTQLLEPFIWTFWR